MASNDTLPYSIKCANENRIAFLLLVYTSSCISGDSINPDSTSITTLNEKHFRPFFDWIHEHMQYGFNSKITFD